MGIEPSSWSCTDADVLCNTGIKEALQDHHRAVKDPNSGKIIHVYAYAGRAAFGENVDRLTFEVEVPYADLNWNVSFLPNYRVIGLLDLLFSSKEPLTQPRTFLSQSSM